MIDRFAQISARVAAYNPSEPDAWERVSQRACDMFWDARDEYVDPENGVDSAVYRAWEEWGDLS